MTMSWSIPTHLEPGPVSGRLGALLCLSSTGHEHAFSMVYDEVSPRIYGLVLRLVVDPQESEEITRETFAEIWRRSAAFDPHANNAAAWMSAIAHRRAVERVRSRIASAVEATA